MAEDMPKKEENIAQAMPDSDDSLTKESLDQLKSDLEEKKHLISGLLDDIKPLEDSIRMREQVTEDMKQRLADQGSKIEELSKDVLDKNKRIQELSASSENLHKDIIARDSMLKVVKDKLTEKTSTLKRVDEKNRQLEQEVDSYRKQVFALENKAASLEKSVFSTNEQNQKLMYELMRMKEQLKGAEVQLAEKDNIIVSQDQDSAGELEKLRREEEEKRVLIMRNHTKKVAILNATINTLKAKLEKQEELIDAKSKKETMLMAEFARGMKDLMASRIDTSIDMSAIERMKEEPLPGEGMSSLVPDAEQPAEEGNSTEGMMQIAPPDEDKPAFDGPSRHDEIIPMVELALDHGDSIDTIKHSLHSSGYTEKEVEEALSKLNVVQQNQ